MEIIMNYHDLSPLEILMKIGITEKIPFEILISPQGETHIRLDGIVYISNTPSYADLNVAAFMILTQGIRKLCDKK